LKIRVLIVDGDRAARDDAASVLADEFEVRACGSAREALKLLQREVFHVVCSNWRMPDMDGLEFFKVMSQRPIPPTACILMTENVEDLAETPSAARKTLGILRKPCPPARFVEQIRHYANIAEMRRTIRNLNVVAGSEKKPVSD
jgi:DNA-binding NtrC family response regulator